MKLDKQTSFTGLSNDTCEVAFQVAAFCVRTTDAGREVLLITSSEDRWIFPKGWPMKGKSDAQAAAIEAWEEAGVKAESVTPEPVARLVTTKAKPDGETEPLVLDVYEIEVATLKNSYPEADKRKRRWVPLLSAANEVDDPAMSGFLAAL